MTRIKKLTLAALTALALAAGAFASAPANQLAKVNEYEGQHRVAKVNEYEGQHRVAGQDPEYPVTPNFLAGQDPEFPVTPNQA